ncbi:YkgJ family cysteine cluster protein [archaeon]|jgi:Fe-S-cluster containining protein|nr:YkgJ family cysteine cluster protein [archaeon]MBT4022279.1 YkgJ family cysteine cluster protein [archaeon]MBT4271764.1 YkgJ family cysteine cluster protein [archaeon]MBT4461408.1 YkgJ family cysteine cluster protein [archaeon]MBT4858664.1 YkgJ family cysteine cluster protein [archaeon]
MKLIDIISLFALILAFFSIYYLKIKPLFLKNKKFKCIHCGKCCKYIVWLTKKDIEKIKTNTKYIKSFFGKKYIKLVKRKCIFLKNKNEKNFCSIYKTRPEICRRFPSKILSKTKTFDSRCNGVS